MLSAPMSANLQILGWLDHLSEMQTNSFPQTKTESTCRGTPVFSLFMAPEIQLEDLKLAGQEDLLKKVGYLVFRIYDVLHDKS